MRINGLKIIEKPWGREIWFAVEDEYAGKILEVRKGGKLSLQYHKRKKETMYVLEGRMKLIHAGGEMLVEKGGGSVTLEPGDRHRVEALEDLKVIEVSTPHLDDIVRLQDDYGRKEKKSE